MVGMTIVTIAIVYWNYYQCKLPFAPYLNLWRQEEKHDKSRSKCWKWEV